MRREPGGPVVRIVGTHFDLTERKGAEERWARPRELELACASDSSFAQEDERDASGARRGHARLWLGEQLTAPSHRREMHALEER